MNIEFHPDAELELLDSIEYYETRQPGLGEAFSLEVEATVHNIQLYPGTWPVLEGQVRRCLVHRFPYGVLYAQEPGKILVLGIMHLHRKPGYWKNRVD
jgi:hypothetical protein